MTTSDAEIGSVSIILDWFVSEVLGGDGGARPSGQSFGASLCKREINGDPGLPAREGGSEGVEVNARDGELLLLAGKVVDKERYKDGVFA